MTARRCGSAELSLMVNDRMVIPFIRNLHRQKLYRSIFRSQRLALSQVEVRKCSVAPVEDGHVSFTADL